MTVRAGPGAPKLNEAEMAWKKDTGGIISKAFGVSGFEPSYDLGPAAPSMKVIFYQFQTCSRDL